MSNPAAEALTKAQLHALLDKLKKRDEYLYAELGGFRTFHDAMRELIRHPPPHPDPQAYWQHIASRIKEACDTLDKMRALLPPEMRLEMKE